MSRVIGIDLGTTYSAVAVLEAGGQPRIVPNREGEDITPSVVLFQDFGAGQEESLVGAMAKHSAASAPDDVVQFVKRHMGEGDYRFESSAGNTYTAEEISAIILKRLKEDTELALGEPVRDVVITVPAYFDDARRVATRHAGEIAGLNVLRVLNEPTAAAIAFGLDADTDSDGTVLVYDLGGGTFDVTLMRITEGEFEAIGTDGDRNLGGFDFDNRLMEYLAGQVTAQGGPDLLLDDAAIAVARERAELAKRSLTSVAQTVVHLTLGGKPYRVPLQRSDFERITRDLLQRTIDLTEGVVDDAGIGFQDIDHVLLVGGSTRMPMVREAVKQLTGKDPARAVNPDEAVALGAAVQGAMAGAARAGQTLDLIDGGPVVVQDVTSQALGVIVFDRRTGRDVNSVIIPRNSKVPAKRSESFFTTHDGQTGVHVVVTQGEDPDPEYIVRVGERELQIPAYPSNSPVEITYAYDIDQTVFVEVRDLVANRSLGTFEVNRVANMTDEQVKAAKDRVAAAVVQ